MRPKCCSLQRLLDVFKRSAGWQARPHQRSENAYRIANFHSKSRLTKRRSPNRTDRVPQRCMHQRRLGGLKRDAMKKKQAAAQASGMLRDSEGPQRVSPESSPESLQRPSQQSRQPFEGGSFKMGDDADLR